MPPSVVLKVGVLEKPSCDMPPPQPGIERLRVEDAPPAAKDGFLVERVHGAESWRKPAVPILFRVSRAVAGVAVAIAREGEAPGPAPAPGFAPTGSKNENTSFFSDDGE